MTIKIIKPNLIGKQNNQYLVYDGDVLVENFRNFYNALKLAKHLEKNNPNIIKIVWRKGWKLKFQKK